MHCIVLADMRFFGNIICVKKKNLRFPLRNLTHIYELKECTNFEKYLSKLRIERSVINYYHINQGLLSFIITDVDFFS